MPTAYSQNTTWKTHSAHNKVIKGLSRWKQYFRSWQKPWPVPWLSQIPTYLALRFRRIWHMKTHVLHKIFNFSSIGQSCQSNLLTFQCSFIEWQWSDTVSRLVFHSPNEEPHEPQRDSSENCSVRCSFHALCPQRHVTVAIFMLAVCASIGLPSVCQL